MNVYETQNHRDPDPVRGAGAAGAVQPDPAGGGKPEGITDLLGQK